MAQLLNLPTIDGNKFIVVNEGVEASYGENLVIAFLQSIRKKNTEYPVNVLLFSNPKYRFEKCLDSSNLSNVQIQDYFSIDLDKCEQNIYEEITNFVTQNSKSIIVIDCLSTLALQIGVAKACRFVEKLYQNHKSLVLCIYKRDLHQNIPRIETLGNIYIKIKKCKKLAFESNVHYEVYVIHKKPGGGIVHWSELVQQNIENYNLRSEKVHDDVKSIKEQSKPVETNIKPQATFRIEMNEQEMKQRDSVPLPYILSGKSSGESKIIYVPDDVDDMDEEDPDDDLDI